MSAGHHADSSIAARVRRLEVLVEDRGLVGGEDLDAILDRVLSGSSPANGTKIVARAWVDPAFRARLLTDANSAIEELGFSMGAGPQPQLLRVVENTPEVHNLVVCTLCSCYPLSLLGPSPSWYKSLAYRSRAVRDPRGVLEEFGLHLAADVEIRVWDASAETRYLVLPQAPPGGLERSEDELAELVTRSGMIGAAAL
ncbi:MAG: nitrile hydratase subunit alpha [Acidimicrobiia bacterium]